jgi:AraC family transcriptional regulator of adaptative response / DNA-3-methyladenine glycosylase II
LLPDNLFGHLAATAVPGVEEWRDGAYRRTLRLPGGAALVELRPPADGADSVAGRAWLTDPADLDRAVVLCRRILDLDADPRGIDDALAADAVLAPLVAAAPGRRVPGAADAAELAIRAVLGQQVSTAAARTHAGRLVARYGEPLLDPAGSLTALFPTPAALLPLRPSELALPEARKRTLLGLVRALADGGVTLDRGVAVARAQLTALPGIGPWTVETVAMRAFADPDAFLPTDLGVRLAAEALGLPTRPAALTARSRAWSPWRAYAVQHLWATGEHAVNRLPT